MPGLFLLSSLTPQAPGSKRRGFLMLHKGGPMRPQPTSYYVASALPVIIVIACTAVIAIAISAWLVHDVAHRAIDRANPDKIPAVLLALGSLLHPLRLFLPWSGRLSRDIRNCPMAAMSSAR
jgi:hypothetical protein